MDAHPRLLIACPLPTDHVCCRFDPQSEFNVTFRISKLQRDYFHSSRKKPLYCRAWPARSIHYLLPHVSPTSLIVFSNMHWQQRLSRATLLYFSVLSPGSTTEPALSIKGFAEVCRKIQGSVSSPSLVHWPGKHRGSHLYCKQLTGVVFVRH